MLNPPSLNAAAGLPWLLRLRWLSLAGQLLVLGVAQSYFGASVNWPLATLVLVAGGLSNLALTRWAERHGSRVRIEPGTSLRVTGWVLTLDTLLLTVLLGASGGAANPFTIVYLVHIVLAALVLSRRWTGALTLLNACAFGVLFLCPQASCHVEPGAGYSDHLRGMWIAFAIAAVVIAYFVQQICVTIEMQRAQIAALAAQARESAHMASLTTLAAGAAHELRSPLSTIAVVAHELKLRFSPLPGDANTLDVELIEAEVERCQEILWSMGPKLSGQGREPTIVAGDALIERLAHGFAQGRSEAGLGAAQLSAPLVVKASGANVAVGCVESELLSALRGLIRNAFDTVANAGSRVELSLVPEGGMVCFRIEDDGEGMSEATAKRAIEPFFTTKEPGKGLGLGLFLANLYAESVGGSLQLRSQLGHGTCAELRLPATPGLRA